MLTGINFSPPLYFLFNFCLQLVFPTSIEQLRIQSLFFIIIGIVLSFLISRKVFGSTPAFIATVLVASQSNLLLSQAQEARHYAMFFAFGAWVLYIQSLNDIALNKYKWLTFLSHFCLCQVHYLGIIFSVLVGTVHFLKSKNPISRKRIPISIALSCVISFITYLFYLKGQKSVLNTWPKPNGISNLISSYNDSLLILTIVIPVLAFILTKKSRGNTKPSSIKEAHFLRPIIISSLLWLSVPLIFWIISHLTSLNLFVDRYFIPKEAALIIITAFLINLLINKMKSTLKIRKNALLPIGGTLILALVIFSIVIKRSLFAIKPERNFYHWLLVKDKISKSNLPLVFVGDPVFFPNAYQLPQNSFFLFNESNLNEVYKKFSNKIHVITNEYLAEFDSFFLISDCDFKRNEIDANFIQQDLGTIHEGLAIRIIQFDKMNEKNLERFN